MWEVGLRHIQGTEFMSKGNLKRSDRGAGLAQCVVTLVLRVVSLSSTLGVELAF